MENRITLHPDTPFFQLCMRVLRQHFSDYSKEKISKTIRFNNAGKLSGEYRFEVEWQDELQSGFDVFKLA
jgi:hypothetical protein